ncbi:MAG: M28 family metallopeptidase [Alphaproteobacteria bacterium]|nr:M28 family metallopeptidase [Alphaproteobacteria bacterium]
MRALYLAGLLAVSSPVFAWAAIPASDIQPDPARLKADITALVGFGTRNSLSDTASPTHGIGAARAWAKAQLAADGAACGGCLTLATPQTVTTGKRIPTPTVFQDVIAIQPGTDDPNRVVIISGHIDSRASNVLDAATPAPGANDDGSGVAAVLETARLLSQHKLHATVVYAVLSGEEQGLIGGGVLADFAKAMGWRVEAVLNNDIVGNSHGLDGKVVDDQVRVFSEGTRADETAAMAAERRRTGAENDAPSRELSRFMAGIAKADMPGFQVRQIFRADRFGRGGDQAPMQAAGFPAVRVTEADENYTRQHQDVRTENGIAYGDVASGVDFSYLARVVRLDALTLARLADAPPPPDTVKISGAVTADTTLSWTAAPGAVGYRVWWRETSAPDWTESRDAGDSLSLTLKGINIDDYAFGVAAIGADGAASPVEFPGAVGAFFAGPRAGSDSGIPQPSR